MKQVPKNEMDALLRKLSQVDSNNSLDPQSGHLDPDELNAYAQNALPAVARAEYTEHLADCSRCRRIVTELTPVTVPVVAAKKDASASFVSEFFSKLTSPLFLRYAVPGLAAVLLLAMGFLFVNRRSGDTVALNEAPIKQVAVSKEDQNSKPQSVVQNDKAVTRQSEESRPTPKSADAPKENAATGTPVDDLSVQQKRSEPARVDATRQSDPAPAAPPAEVGRVAGEREVAKSTEVGEKKTEAAKPQPAKEEARKLSDYDSASGSAKNSASDSAKDAPKARIAPSTRRGASAPAAATQNEAAGRERQQKSDKETRRVAGHSFSKVNGVWIDEAYDSRTTVDLSRSSEQFRALVADEPGIRNIAEQLDGEIIVLWKGRAYRIR